MGVVGFVAPFLGCTAVAYFGLHGLCVRSWLARRGDVHHLGRAVDAVMLELVTTNYGKTILACLASSMTLGRTGPCFNLQSLYVENRRYFSGGQHRYSSSSPPYVTPLLQTLRQSTLGARGKISPACPLRLGALATWSGEVRRLILGVPGGNGGCRHRGQRPCPDLQASNPHIRPFDTGFTSSARSSDDYRFGDPRGSSCSWAARC